MVPSSTFQGAPVWEDPPWSNQENYRGRNASDCARPTGREEACVPRCALIVIRASVHPAAGQVPSGTGPQAVRNSADQGNVRTGSRRRGSSHSLPVCEMPSVGGPSVVRTRQLQRQERQ